MKIGGQKPNLMYLSPQCPYPPIDGGKIGIYFPVLYLSKYFSVSLVFPADNMVYKESVTSKFRSFGVQLNYFQKDTRGFFVDLKYLMLNFGEELPFKWRKYYCRNAQKLINDMALRDNVSLILVSSPHMMKYALGIRRIKPDVKIFFREHNIEYSLVEQFGRFVKNPVYKAITRWQLEKSKEMEIRYWKEADRVFFISDGDYEIATSVAPQLSEKFRVIYDGYKIKFNDVFKVNNSDFIYTANLNAIQNEISFRWFIEKVWIPNLPYVRRKNIKIYITGNSQDVIRKKLRRYGSIQELNIENLGFLNNVEEEMRKYKYVLSPTIIGSGIRLKLLNGMACSKPVFVTPLDIKTTKHFKDMENVVCFEDSESFMRKLTYLENNDDIYYGISKNAIETIKKYFTWENYAECVYGEYLRICTASTVARE